jgi:uncharacterized membrane protein YfcA
MATIIISFVIGLTAGSFGGLIGTGGGIIMIPLMVEVLKLPKHKSHGTSMVTMVFTGIGGAITYLFRRSLNTLFSSATS